jgi:hypothetical protein
LKTREPPQLPLTVAAMEPNPSYPFFGGLIGTDFFLDGNTMFIASVSILYSRNSCMIFCKGEKPTC